MHSEDVSKSKLNDCSVVCLKFRVVNTYCLQSVEIQDHTELFTGHTSI